MAVFLDKLKTRGLQRIGKEPPESPLPSITETISTPPKPLTTKPLSNRIGGLPQRGTVGSLPQFANIKQRFLADLPAKVQLQGIQAVLSGADSGSPIINNFVKGMAAKGAQPEDIRQAFINQQKSSDNPLVLT